MSIVAEGSAWLWSWWWSAMTSPVAVGCAVLMVALVGAAAVLLRAAVRVGSDAAAGDWPGGGEADRSLTVGARCAVGRGGESGTATVEFVLIVPVLLAVVLLLVQTTLVMGGNLFVHYSASAAVRSAVVQIPQGYDGEPENWYADVRGSRKREAIRRAAAMALLPVAGPQGAGAGDQAWLGPGVAEGLALMHRRLGEAEPMWVTQRMSGRMRYAIEQTEVRVVRVPGEGSGDGTSDVGGNGDAEGPRWSARDAVGVHVEHRLHLPVPYVNRVFADGRTAWGGWTMSLDAQSMLTNFGLSDRLPEKPELERIP